MIVYFVLTSY